MTSTTKKIKQNTKSILQEFLNNLIASYIFSFSNTFKVGDYILLKNGQDSIQGQIIAQNFFNVKIKQYDGSITLIPSNLFFEAIIIKYSPLNPSLSQPLPKE